MRDLSRATTPRCSRRFWPANWFQWTLFGQPLRPQQEALASDDMAGLRVDPNKMFRRVDARDFRELKPDQYHCRGRCENIEYSFKPKSEISSLLDRGISKGWFGDELSYRYAGGAARQWSHLGCHLPPRPQGT